MRACLGSKNFFGKFADENFLDNLEKLKSDFLTI